MDKLGNRAIIKQSEFYNIGRKGKLSVEYRCCNRSSFMEIFFYLIIARATR